MPRIYASNTDYIRDVTLASSDTLGWRCIRVSRAAESSNHVAFKSVSRNTINVTLSGTIRHTTRMDGIRDHRPTRPGQAILMPAGLSAQFAWTTHGIKEQTILIEFDDEIFATYCPEVQSGRFLAGHLKPAHYADKPEIVALATMLVRELDPTTRRGRLVAEQAIRLLALEIAHSDWTRAPLSFVEGRAFDPRVKRVVDLIEARFAEDLSLFDLMTAAGLSASQLITLFKRQTSQTPYAYLVQRRLAHAVHLLRTTTIPIVRIAHASGFADQQHMTRVFQKRLRQTPGRFRSAGIP